MTTLVEHIREGKNTLATSELDDDFDFSSLYPKLPGFRFNHVISAKSDNNNSNLISNRIDRKVLRAIRSKSDLIVTTGKTAVAENLNASNLAPMLLITNNEDLKVPATEIESIQPVFVTTEHAIFSNPAAQNIGRTQGHLADWLKDFAKSFPSVVLETGLSTAIELQELIMEICLTVVDSEHLESSTFAAEVLLRNFENSYVCSQLFQIDTNWFFRFEMKRDNR